jgi:phage tail-like protein
MATTIAQRAYTAGRWGLDIDGAKCGFLQSVEGGHAKADIVEHKSGAGSSSFGPGYNAKNITLISYEPIKFKAGAGMSKGFWEWLKAAMDLGVLYKNGAITACNFNYESMRRMDILNMLMTKLSVPALKADAKDNLYFDFEAKAEMVRWMKEGGQKYAGASGTKQKAWHVSNFRLEGMGGLPLAKVNEISGITWECKAVPDAVGEMREYEQVPVALTVSDFKMSISMKDLDPWAQKADDWFRLGHCLQDNEMTLDVVLLEPDMSTEVGRIQLSNVGLKSFQANPKYEAGTESVARFGVECYAEKITTDFKLSDQ